MDGPGSTLIYSPGIETVHNMKKRRFGVIKELLSS